MKPSEYEMTCMCCGEHKESTTSWCIDEKDIVILCIECSDILDAMMVRLSPVEKKVIKSSVCKIVRNINKNIK